MRLITSVTILLPRLFNGFNAAPKMCRHWRLLKPIWYTAECQTIEKATCEGNLGKDVGPITPKHGTPMIHGPGSIATF